MSQKQWILPSSHDGLGLEILEIMPEQSPKGIVVILHGMAEHKERYLYFMEQCRQKGYGALIYDQRGHGNSVRTPEDWGYFYEEDACFIVEDVQDVVRRVHETYPRIPVYLFAHSMGTLVARLYCKRYDDQIDKMILSGAVAQNKLVDVALVLTKLLRIRYGDHHRSRFLQNLAFGSYDRQFEGTLKNRWLSENVSNVIDYNKEEKDGYIFTLNGFGNLFSMVRQTYDVRGWKRKHPDLPIFFVAGQDDPVIGSLSKWEQAQEALRQQGYRSVQGKLYPHMRHEILQEQKKDIVIHDILSFLED